MDGFNIKEQNINLSLIRTNGLLVFGTDGQERVHGPEEKQFRVIWQQIASLNIKWQEASLIRQHRRRVPIPLPGSQMHKKKPP